MIWRTLNLLYLLLHLILVTRAGPSQHPLGQIDETEITPAPVSLFASFERLARLVDISYCIGNTGVSKPFNCVSRCKDFPTLSLVQTWNTGILLSDSCGYIAVDHGVRQHDHDKETGHSRLGGPDKAIVIAFRGTYSITNTVVDLSTIPQEYVPFPAPGDDDDENGPEHKCDNCTVHMGFLASWSNARKLVIPELKVLKELYPSYPIHLIGHSLGGAVACLAALELKVSLGWEDVTVTTFGEPRLGDKALANYVDEVFDLNGDVHLDKRAYRRVTHKSDPVPLLPLSDWGFASHGGEFYISKDSLPPSEIDLRECTGNADPLCSAEGDRTISDMLRRIFYRTKDMETLLGGTHGNGIPTRYKLWQLFFAHRDYFWRLGLCVPGGDPIDWGRDKYNFGQDEL